MRSAAKIALVFLLGMMLAGTQGAALTANLSGSACCAPPACTRPCCATRQAPAPQPEAPAPAPSNSSSLVIAVLARTLTVLPVSRPAVSISSSSALLVATAVPLYKRACTYLI